MTTKSFLSNKRNRKLSFSASEALIDWIKRYVKTMRKNNPEDERYRSVSSFAYHVMEKSMELFQKGKSLDDLERVPDREISDFYDKITFKAVIPWYEEEIETNKYIYPSKKFLSFLLKMKNFVLKDDRIEFYGKEKALENLVSRFRKFLTSNKLTKDINSYYTETGIVFEYSGNYTNIHYAISKFYAAFFGIAGCKARNIVYLKKYVRFEFEFTDLLYDTELRLQERKKLMAHNLDQFIKLENIVDDKTHHLWLNTAASTNAIISFQDFESGLKYLNSMIEKLPHEERNLRILKIFEHFHWITIDDEKTLSYRFLLPKKEHELEYSLMSEVLLESNIMVQT